MFKFLWKLIKWTVIYPVILFLVAITAWMIIDPEGSGYNESSAKNDQERLEKCIADIGSDNCTENGYETQAYKDEQKRIRAEEKAERERIKAEEKAERERIKAEEKAHERRIQVQKEAEERRKGFHCLSAWNGSHTQIVNYTKKQLRDPKSFEHIETRITPKNPQGDHQLVMQYRAKNGFGGMTVGAVVASVRNNDCSATILKIN